jgi:hypothetical protein
MAIRDEVERNPIMATGSAALHACARCGSRLIADALPRPPLRQVSRLGAPARPRPPLPTWRCLGCGTVQPRID